MKFYTILLFTLLALSLTSANPFITGAPAQAPTDSVASVEPEVVEPGQGIAAPSGLLSVQKDLQETISGLMKKLKESFSLKTLTLFLLLCLLYGMIHSLGPGHAKLIIGSKLIAGKHKKRDALSAGIIFSATHTGMALLLFGVVHIILKLNSAASDKVAANLLEISGVFIMLIAVYLFIEAVIEFREKEHEEKKGDGKSLYALAMSAGLAPCPGALLILVFSNILGIQLYGIFAVLAVSTGMAITVSTIGILTVTGRQGMVGAAGSKVGTHKVIPLIFRTIGSIVIIIVGWSFL